MERRGLHFCWSWETYAKSITLSRENCTRDSQLLVVRAAIGWSHGLSPQIKESQTTKFKSRKLTSPSPLSETFQSALGKVDLGKYIDQVQDELKRAVADIGPGRTPGEVEAIQARLQDLIRRQATDLAKEVGFLGNQAMVFMLSNSIISTAWVSFTLRRETSDLSKSPEDRLALIEMFDALANSLADVIHEGSNHADVYGATAGGGSQDDSAGKARS